MSGRDEYKEDVEVAAPGKLFVGQLPKHMNEDELKKLFESFGELSEVVILRHRMTKDSKGCGFVTFKHTAEADRAIASLHNQKNSSSY
jgi:RNA recognition motif-containing protein